MQLAVICCYWLLFDNFVSEEFLGKTLKFYNSFMIFPMQDALHKSFLEIRQKVLWFADSVERKECVA